MYYKARQGRSEQERGAELSAEQLDRARRGFRAALGSRRFHPDTIASNCEEMLAIAQMEYARVLASGREIEEPVSWLIRCAYRRMQNVLTATSRQPLSLSEDTLKVRIEEAAPSLEQELLDEDRARKVRRAIGALSEDQRRLLALTYFSDNSIRGAARLLGWDAGKAKRCHKAALKKIKAVLGVEKGDELQLEIAVIAWLSLGAGGTGAHMPSGFEAALDRASHGADAAISRAHELARRITLGGDAAGALAGSGAGRGVGACATVLVAACIAGAGAVVVPGTGLLGHQNHTAHAVSSSGSPSARSSEAVSRPASESPPPSKEGGSPAGESAGQPELPKGGKASEAEQVKQQTDAFARAAEEPDAEPPSSAPPPPPPAHPAAQAQAAQQFGGFR